MMTLGVWLKQLRMKSGFTQVELSQRAKLSHTFISQLENGKHKSMSAPALFALAGALNVKPESILKFTKSRRSNGA